jgi:coatomer subunit beta
LQVCRTKPADKGKYIKIILAMLGSTKPVVVYDCATLLTSLSQAPTAVRAAANCFCQLLVTHSDNNVKLIVLDRLSEQKAAHTDVLSEVLMDIMRALSTPSFDIRRKILDLAMDLITPKNINEVCSALLVVSPATNFVCGLFPVVYEEQF